MSGNVQYSDCSFLKLPTELRRRIYWYLLPHTACIQSTTGTAHVWLRGNTSLLATNHQIHEEAADMLYGDSVWVVEVGFDRIIFRYRRLLVPQMLVPQSTPLFLETVSPRYLERIRTIAINVEHVDDYTGTIKYHRSGRRLSEGILRQVETLVKALSTAKAIQMIRVNFVDRTNGDLPSTQRVLEPFVGLTNVCGNFVMTGAVSGDMARWCGAKQR